MRSAVAHVGTRQGELLPLAAGEINPTLESPPHHLLVAVGQPVNHTLGQALVGGGGDAARVGQRFQPAEADVLAHQHAVAEIVLKDHADFVPQVFDIVFPQVDAIQQNAAVHRIVEPGQQFHHGGFAGAVLAG
jgi:hypothetical protein